MSSYQRVLGTQSVQSPLRPVVLAFLYINTNSQDKIQGGDAGGGGARWYDDGVL